MYFICIVNNKGKELIMSMRSFVAVEDCGDTLYFDFKDNEIECKFSTCDEATFAFENFKSALSNDNLLHIICEDYTVNLRSI